MAQSTYLVEYIFKNEKKKRVGNAVGAGDPSKLWPISKNPDFRSQIPQKSEISKCSKIANFLEILIFHRLELILSPLNRLAKHNAVD